MIKQLDRGDCFTTGTLRYYSRDSHPNISRHDKLAFDKYIGDTYHGIREISALELSNGSYLYSAALSKKQVMMLERSLTYDMSLSDRYYQPR